MGFGILGKTKKVLDNLYEERTEKNMYRMKNEPVHEYLKLNPMPELSKNDKQIIDKYWAQYGIKIIDYSWFQWYCGLNKKVDPRYIPNDIYAYIIWPFYNNEQFRFAWKDKNYFERFLPDVPFPEVILRKINGRFYDSHDKFISETEKKEIVQLLINEEEVIVKDAWDSGEGRGVTKYKIKSVEDAEKLIQEWNSDNYIVQKIVKQNKCFAQFNESSVNIMRISSWYHEGKVEILAPTLRVGTKGQVTDISYINGIETVNVVGITKDGYFKNELVTQDGKSRDIYEIIEKGNEKIPKWHEIIKLIKEKHKKLGHFDIIGWDFTVTDDDKIVCIEYNVQRPGTVFYQYVNGPFFGEHTDKVLEFLKDKENQKKYIPKRLRV